MFAGRIAERGRRDDLFENPQHPYTLQLLAALAQYPSDESRVVFSQADVAPGGSACVFLSRCPVATDPCRKAQPALAAFTPTHSVACWRAPFETALR
jgi:oligopeptide/dipeptide ABC transporter ATP-binding protein